MVPVIDESKAPAGSPGRKRRPGGARLRGMVIRLRPDLHQRLEQEARDTEVSKVSIIEDALGRRYKRRPAR